MYSAFLQSLKMTSKSLAVNASTVLEASLDAVDALDWNDDDVTGMVRMASTAKILLFFPPSDFNTEEDERFCAQTLRLKVCQN